MNSIGRKPPTHIGNLPIPLAYLDCLFFFICHCEEDTLPDDTVLALGASEQSPRRIGDCFGLGLDTPFATNALGYSTISPRNDGELGIGN